MQLTVICRRKKKKKKEYKTKYYYFQSLKDISLGRTNRPSHSQVETQTSKLNDPLIASKSADLEQILHFLRPLKKIVIEGEGEGEDEVKEKEKKFIGGTKRIGIPTCI